MIFAYGSNLSVERLRARAPSARFTGRAVLRGHQLRFHKRGADGSAKANAFPTGNDRDRVWGAVFECSDPDRSVLDRVEGGYHAETAAIEMDDGSVERAEVYIAATDAIDDALLPFEWYLAYVVAGAVQHGLPQDYVDAIRNQPAEPDPDPHRRARNTTRHSDDHSRGRGGPIQRARGLNRP